jgi:hypothetical protein
MSGSRILQVDAERQRALVPDAHEAAVLIGPELVGLGQALSEQVLAQCAVGFATCGVNRGHGQSVPRARSPVGARV